MNPKLRRSESLDLKVFRITASAFILTGRHEKNYFRKIRLLPAKSTPF